METRFTIKNVFLPVEIHSGINSWSYKHLSMPITSNDIFGNMDISLGVMSAPLETIQNKMVHVRSQGEQQSVPQHVRWGLGKVSGRVAFLLLSLLNWASFSWFFSGRDASWTEAYCCICIFSGCASLWIEGNWLAKCTEPWHVHLTFSIHGLDVKLSKHMAASGTGEWGEKRCFSILSLLSFSSR